MKNFISVAIISRANLFFRVILFTLASLSGLLANNANAVQGEWWEITSKMEMPGMPPEMAGMMGSMGAQKQKVCLAKGQQADPAATSKDDNCTISDMRQSGNTVKFNMKCTGKDAMTGSAELTHTPNNFTQKIKMRQDGEDMLMTSTGKRIGGACDADELRKKGEAMAAQADAQNKKQTAAMCDTSKYTAKDWAIYSNQFIGAKPLCPGKQKDLCQVMNKEAPRNVDVFTLLQSQQSSRESTVKACGINMATTQKSLCKNRALKGPEHFLAENCPAELKVYRELVRKRQDCEERGFTSGEELKSCMGGKELTLDDGDGNSSTSSSQSSSQAGATNKEEKKGINSKDVLDGAKQLKGLFGF